MRQGRRFLRAGDRARAFTLVELMIVVALLAVLAVLVLPRIATVRSDPAAELQRFLWAAVDASGNGRLLRLRVDGKGMLVSEIFLAASGERGEWAGVPLAYRVAEKGWVAETPCLVHPDGGVSPWRVVNGAEKERREFVVTVTGMVYPAK